ncbi:hypothetical protein TrST_g7669 [Triparma strigata]|uniref:Cytochrome P450 n=1 Tax=Triparma strigata TaxID=1606541 RepID=A0A9W6ZSN0_9STRA|nr:hypothetical protein TrST_g7669 [Triparma strigata]
MISVLGAIFSVIGAGLAVMIVQFLMEMLKISHIPATLALPLVGHLYHPGAPMVMKFLSVMRRRHGKIFAFWPGNSPMIVVMEPKCVRQILTDTKTFIKGADYSNKFALVFGEGLVTSNGDKHRGDRGCLSKFFVRGAIEKYMDFMVQETQLMIQETMVPANGKEIDLQEFFHMLALRVFGYFAAGHDYSKDPEAKWINHCVSNGSNIIGEHIVLGLPVWGFIPRIKSLKADVAKMHQHVEKLIQAREKQRSEAKPDWVEPEDPLKGMLDAKMSRKEMYEQFTTLLSAGHDTTAFFGCYMAYLLASHPEVQQKVKDEVKEVLGDRTDIKPEDAKKMTYTANVMKEVLRLYTVIPFVNRTTVKDVNLRENNMKIPSGTTCLVPLCLMNRDPDVWEDPNEFRPERFEGLGISDNSAKHGYLPFGYGSRTCIGNTLALIEGNIMFALLMQKLTFKKVEDFKPKITAGISLVSSNGIRVRVELD